MGRETRGRSPERVGLVGEKGKEMGNGEWPTVGLQLPMGADGCNPIF